MYLPILLEIQKKYTIYTPGISTKNNIIINIKYDIRKYEKYEAIISIMSKCRT